MKWQHQIGPAWDLDMENDRMALESTQRRLLGQDATHLEGETDLS